jgi:hypothetical protein
MQPSVLAFDRKKRSQIKSNLLAMTSLAMTSLEENARGYVFPR